MWNLTHPLDVEKGGTGHHENRTGDPEKTSAEVASAVPPSMTRHWPGQEKDNLSRMKCMELWVEKAVTHVRNYEKDRMAKSE